MLPFPVAAFIGAAIATKVSPEFVVGLGRGRGAKPWLALD